MKTKLSKKDYEDFYGWAFLGSLRKEFKKLGEDERKFIKYFERKFKNTRSLFKLSSEFAYLFMDVFEEGNSLKKYKISNYAFKEVFGTSLFSRGVQTNRKLFKNKVNNFLCNSAFRHLCDNFVGDRGFVYFEHIFPIRSSTITDLFGGDVIGANVSFYYSIQEDYLQIIPFVGKLSDDKDKLVMNPVFTINNDDDFNKMVDRYFTIAFDTNLTISQRGSDGHYYTEFDVNGEKIKVRQSVLLEFMKKVALLTTLNPTVDRNIDKMFNANTKESFLLHLVINENLADDQLFQFLIFEGCLETLLYLKLSKTREEHFETSFGKRLDSNKVANEGFSGIISVDKFYTTEVHVDHPFGVRGHFRNQYIGLDEDGNKKHKLIWISEFEKKGYHRRATKNIIENEE